jgi:hypothetical protein
MVEALTERHFMEEQPLVAPLTNGLPRDAKGVQTFFVVLG